MERKEFLRLYDKVEVKLLGTIEGITFFQDPKTKFVCWVELEITTNIPFKIPTLMQMLGFNGNEFQNLDKTIQITVNYLNELNALEGEIYIEESGLLYKELISI